MHYACIMTFDTSILTESQVRDTINIVENQFNDVKSKEIKPGKLSESVSASQTLMVENYLLEFMKRDTPRIDLGMVSMMLKKQIQ